MENQEEKLHKAHSGRDRDAVLKAFKILETFYREHGEPDVAEALEERRAKFEEKWERVV